ncbi:hypothetical protein ABMA28_000381 [Loxostege sticticalis]|uniref:Uncharacterized protein n=1 Tax=Loxostege sticticalis TaxID=481309 RepID=A0ABD0TS08_LOXSC
MQFIIALIVSSMIMKVISSDTTDEPTSPRESQPITGSVTKLDPVKSNPVLNALWAHRPQTHQHFASGDGGTTRVAMKPAHSMTRLAKAMRMGFEPYFSKGYFEPFERRPKPVTLVAFRKNGLLPRTRENIGDKKSREIAELQSPFNDVSNFWVDDFSK